MVGLAMLSSMVFTETLPLGRFIALTTPIAPLKLGIPAEEKPARPQPAGVPFQQVWPGVLALPTRMPDRAVTIVDEPQVTCLGSSEGTVGVVGGIGDPNGVAGGILPKLLGSVPLPAKPQAEPTASKEIVAKPGEPKRMVVGGVVQAARLTHNPSPLYPPLARQARVSGMVRLEAIIAVNGSVANLRGCERAPAAHPVGGRDRAAMEIPSDAAERRARGGGHDHRRALHPELML